MIIDATFEEKGTMLNASFDTLAKGDKGDKGDKGEPFVYDDLNAEQKQEIKADLGVADLERDVRLLKLANEGNTYDFLTVADTAAEHTVPNNALPYAVLDSIGGYTRKCTNLLALKPNEHLGYGKENNEVESLYEVYIDENGYLTIDSNGVDTGISATLLLPEELFKNIPKGTKVSTYVRYVSGSANGGYANGDIPVISMPGLYMNDTEMKQGATYTETSTYNPTYGNIMQAVGVFDNLKLAITVVEGSTAVDDHLYFEGLKSAKVNAVKSYGKNLYDGDAEITLNGAQVSRILCSPDVEGTTHFSFKREGTYGNQGGIFNIVFTDGTNYIVGPTTLDTTLTFTKKIRHIQLVNWALCVGRVYDIQLERGSAATDYSPYFCDTYTVPSEVQALDGYGEGIDTANSNIVDLNAKTYKECIETFVFDGGEGWFAMAEQGGNKNYYGTKIGENGAFVKNCVVSDRYNQFAIFSQNAEVGINTATSSVAGGDIVSIRPKNVESFGVGTDSFKVYLAENPVTAKVARTTATETDIAEYIPDTVYLKVEAGGYIVGENDDGIESNIGITYQIKL